jgi:hypothetical protein
MGLLRDAFSVVYVPSLWKKSTLETEVRSDASPVEGLRQALHALCQLPANWAGLHSQMLPTIATENVQRVSETLQSLNTLRWRPEDTDAWVHRPRTYIILHNLDLVYLMNKFVQDGMTDFLLPYNDVTLPDYIQPRAMRESFLKVQQYLLTDARILEDLSAGVSSTKVLPHIHLSDGGNQHFKRLRMLGKGSFGYVTQYA